MAVIAGVGELPQGKSDLPHTMALHEKLARLEKVLTEIVEDENDQDYYNEVLPEEGSHYAEIEKPVDLDDFADAIRKNNENYKVASGKMKSVKYRN